MYYRWEVYHLNLLSDESYDIQPVQVILIWSFRGSQAAIVVYDITNMESFKRAKVWIKELRQQTSADIVIALTGNKADLTSERGVQSEVT